MRLIAPLFALVAGLAALSPVGAIDESQLLPVEEAFAATTAVVGAAAAGDERVRLTWTIADGYYLYRHRFGFESATQGVTLGEPVYPHGEEKEDEFFGLVETYRGVIEVDIPVLRDDPGVTDLTITTKSQGCADLGVCYPPNRRTLTVQLPALADGGLALTSPDSGSLGLGTAPGGGLDFGAQQSTALFGADALPVDEAFAFELIADGPEALLARWTIAPGYYLYRDKIDFLVDGGQPATVAGFDPPPGIAMVDEHFGDVEVFYDVVEVPVRLTRTDAAAGPLQITGLYQGCKEAGICYPPQERLMTVALPAAPSAVGRVAEPAPTTPAVSLSAAEPAFESEQDRLARGLSQNAWVALLLFYGAGLLLAFTPCVFPMVPILSGIIAGQGKDITTGKALLLSVVYVLAMALTYTVAGVVAGYTGYNIQAAFQNAWLLGAFALFFAILSLAMFGFYELQIPASWQTRLNQLSNRQQGGTLIGVAIMGFLSALVVGPCVAPPLVGALIYISQSGDPLLGGLALFALSMGMGTPLIIIGASAGKLLPRAGSWMDAVKAVFGVGLLALSIWMLERISPPGLIMVLWGALAVGSAIYLGALEPIAPGASGWLRLRKALGVFLLLLGALQLIGAAAGGRDYLMPLKGVFGSSAPAASAEYKGFTRIKSLDDLQRRLAASDGPAMLDFYADWCVDCKRMDKYTFPEPPVVAALENVLTLKADVTANDDIDQALMSHFSIIGPPAILFFDDNGQELRQYRVVGYQRPEAFAEHVQRAVGP